MKKLQMIFAVFFLSILFIPVTRVLAQDITVQISDPSRNGVEVRKTYIVKGVASIPVGSHLWILARREDFEGLWWPQGEGRVNPLNNEWQVPVTFGIREDIGWNFDIAAVVVSEKNHILFRDYRNTAMKTGDWRPIELPEVLTAPILLKVKKIGD